MTEAPTVATTELHEAIPTPEELVARAQSMIPQLRERSARTEELRMIPPETVQEWIDLGLVRSATPRRFGGYGYGPDVVVEIGMQLGRGCGSSGWMGAFYPGHQHMVGWFGEQAQAEYWADGPDTLSATASAIVSYDGHRVDGGLHITSARVRLSSGIDHSAWVIFHTPEETVLVPRDSWTIDDDWFVSGLKGTGSKTIVIENAFVPEHRIVSHADMAAGLYPGRELSDSPFYKLPNPPVVVLPNMILCAVIGMAQGVVDVFDERIRRRVSHHTQDPAIERPMNQYEFAESSVEVDIARMLLRNNLKRLQGWPELDEIPLEERARSRRDLGYACRLCIRATDRLIASGDAGALYEVNDLHRLGRDVRGGGLQYALNWEEMALQYSRVLWGLPPQTFLI